MKPVATPNLPRDVSVRADFYLLNATNILTALRMRLGGWAITYDSASLAIRVLSKIPGLGALCTRLLTRTTFEKTISEYEGALYLIQHETVRLTQEYYRAAGFGRMRPLQVYQAHYRTTKFEPIVKSVLQREIKRFLIWLYRQRQVQHPARTLIVPDDALHRFVMGRVDRVPGIAWPVRFAGSIDHGVLGGLRELTKCWIRLGKALWRQGLCTRSSKVETYPIGFRAHWPRKEGLLRTDFLIDGHGIDAGNVMFYLENAKTGDGKAMCAFLRAQGYRYVAVNQLAYPVRSLPRLIGDYAWLPFRCFLASLSAQEPACCALLVSISQIMLLSKIDLLLDHYRFRVLFSFHSAGPDLMVSPVLCQRNQCQFITYNFGTTPYRARWADFAFFNAHAFLSWGPEVLSVYRDTHAIDEVIDTGFWGFAEYRKALNEREKLRAILGVGPQTRLLVFYDIPYFPERSSFTARLLCEFYQAALACSELEDAAVVLKMKNRHNENIAIYPLEVREAFRTLWDAIKARPNVSLCVTRDWDPLQMIAASDVNVTLELSTPSTIALLCGKVGFFFNTVEGYVCHPLFPKYKGRLIFDDADALVDAIKRYLDHHEAATPLVEPGDLDGYNAGGDEAGLDRFRQETLRRARLARRPGVAQGDRAAR